MILAASMPCHPQERPVEATPAPQEASDAPALRPSCVGNSANRKQAPHEVRLNAMIRRSEDDGAGSAPARPPAGGSEKIVDGALPAV
jgi:hypothetical protein